MDRRWFKYLVAGAAALVCLSIPAGAAATSCNLNLDPCMGGMSTDGRYFFWETSAAHLSEDKDNGGDDVYGWSEDGGLELISDSSVAGGQANAFAGVSSDGLRVYLRRSNQGELWERTAAGATLVADDDPFQTPAFRGRGDDGSIYFSADQVPGTGDTDGATDLYARANGVNTWISRGPSGGNGNIAANFAGVSNSGRVVFFVTDEQLVSFDTDTVRDVYSYDRYTGTTRKVSAGSAAIPAQFAGSSADGSRPFFITREAVASTDTDDALDIYERDPDGPSIQITRGQINGNGDFDVGPDPDAPVRPWPRIPISADGSKVVFATGEQLTTSDTDSTPDVYVRSGSTTTHVSQKNAGASGADPDGVGAQVSGISSDGSSILFTDSSRLTSDTPAGGGIFVRAGGQTRRIAQHGSPYGGLPSFIGPLGRTISSGISPSGNKVFFQTSDLLAPSDSNPPGTTSSDAYAWRTNGAYEHLTLSEVGEHQIGSDLVGISDDAETVFIQSFDRLTSDDHFGGWDDFYVRRDGDTRFVSPDFAPPNTVAGGPAEGANVDAAGATFTPAADEGLVVFRCKLDDGPVVGCANRQSESTDPNNGKYLTGPLSPGPHTVVITAVDSGGNLDPTPFVRHFNVGGDDGGSDEGGGEGGVEGTVAGPGVTIHKVIVPHTARKLIRKGIRVLATCDNDCRIVVDVRVSNSVALRMHLRSLRFAHGSAPARAGKRRWVVAPLTASAARGIQTYGGGGHFQVKVRAAGP
jgi:hypothetical protein